MTQKTSPGTGSENNHRYFNEQSRLKIILKIGLIADTHDNIENIEKAVEVFKESKADLVIHAGDYVSPEAIRFFRGVKLVGVFGNNDFDKSGIRDAFSDIGGQIKG